MWPFLQISVTGQSQVNFIYVQIIKEIIFPCRTGRDYALIKRDPTNPTMSKWQGKTQRSILPFAGSI